VNRRLFRILLRPSGGLQGEVRQPTTNDPLPVTINGQARLSETEVRSIISYAADRARTTRAGIRLPIGIHMEVFITVVNNPNQPGVEPTVLGTFRAGGSDDVQLVYYSSRDLLGFGRNIAMYFWMLAGPELAKRHHNFSGGFPLYRNGVLIGAIGISGDGGDQDDIVGASGTHDFLAPDSIRADQFVYKGARLPYAKFPRDPNGANGVNEVVTQLHPPEHSPTRRRAQELLMAKIN
jgi:hypothetical protein